MPRLMRFKKAEDPYTLPEGFSVPEKPKGSPQSHQCCKCGRAAGSCPPVSAVQRGAKITWECTACFFTSLGWKWVSKAPRAVPRRKGNHERSKT